MPIKKVIETFNETDIEIERKFVEVESGIRIWTWKVEGNEREYIYTFLSID